MCKYCEKLKKQFDFDKNKRGKAICDGEYEYCCIIKDTDDGSYYIGLYGSFETFSDEISFCPFCGRKLKKD